MTPQDQQHMHLVAYIQSIDDEKLRRAVQAYAGDDMEKVAKIVTMIRHTNSMLQQNGFAYTMVCLSTSNEILEGYENVDGYRSFLEYLVEDTRRAWRN